MKKYFPVKHSINLLYLQFLKMIFTVYAFVYEFELFPM